MAYGFQIGEVVRSVLRYTDAIGLTGIIQSFDLETDRVRVSWSDGVVSSERPEYLERVKETA